MSKKRLHNRLENLFSNLANETAQPPDQTQEAAKIIERQLDLRPTSPVTTPAVENLLLENPLHSAPNHETNPHNPGFGVALEKGSIAPAKHIWTDAGKRSLANRELVHANADGNAPAAIAIPLDTQKENQLLLEIVDDTTDREWSEDDRSFVLDIAGQLALALDNAQLYQSVQQELSERIQAEQLILRRNKDLASLNQIGQQLSHLTTRAEIFQLLAQMVGEVLDSKNLYICSYDAKTHILSFPIYRQDGQNILVADRPFGQGFTEYLIQSQEPLLITKDVRKTMVTVGIPLPDPVPASILAIPLVTGDRATGVIVVQDNEHAQAFDKNHAELLSTVASQAATALENAELFQQMQTALEAIENRERYQANVARSAAILTESGTKSMAEVLKMIGQAAQCSRVYFADVQEDDRGVYWSITTEWVDPSVAYLFDKTRLLHIPSNTYMDWAMRLREKGWVVTQSTENSPEGEFINSQHIRTTLLLSIPGSKSTPSFIAFDQLGNHRNWLSEEINVLRVAADAIANTFVREGLLGQLQVTLEETEGLYQASNRLAVANDMQDMLAAVLSGVRASDLNRAVLVLFEHDSYGKTIQISVGANWYSGKGTPPPPIGTEYLRARYERFLQSQTPIFYDDILETQIDKELQDTLLHQKIRSLAILPLWISKRQIGAVMLQTEDRRRFSEREKRTYPPLVDQMAISVENQRLFNQTQQALSETELLYNVSNRIAQSTSAEDMLSLVTETVLPKGAQGTSLILISSSPEGELIELEVVGYHSASGQYQPIGVHLPIDQVPLIKSLTDEPLVITDIAQYPLDPASREVFKQFDIASGCFIPLRTSGRLTGLLNAVSDVPAEFTQDDTHLLRIVGNGIAVALEKQRLLGQAQRRALELQTASEIARDTASTLSPDVLLNRIVNMLRERFNFYHASLYLLDESHRSAIIRESSGEAGAQMKRSGQKLAVGSKSVIGVVTATGEPLILHNAQQDSLYIPNPLLPETRSEMGMPLKLGLTVIGALDLHSKEVNAFTQDDVTVLRILADQIAIAIENARAYDLSQKAIEDMREIDRVKSQFLANMSHELRTPLNSIIGFSRVILKGIDGPINETQNQDLSAIYNSGQHLLSLINDILDLSKIEAGKMELSLSEINLTDMINSAMSTAVGLVKDKDIKLKTIVQENLPHVQADNTRVRQVLINFLSNAAKFTDEGTITVEASLTRDPQGKSEVLITVTDTGPGIAAADQAKLFLPFSQVDDSPTRKTGGTGLGLSICRSLIDMHDGRIGLLKSEVGKGSTFFFTLPVVLPEPQMITPQTLEPAHNVLLAIDDDQKVISLYERYLQPYGYQVVALNNPRQAVEQAAALQPFAITLDIMMPDKDGWEVMRELKNNPATQNIPIVICSILENQELGFSMGAADYLVKPFLQEDMLNAIQRLNSGEETCEVLVIDDDPADLRLVQKILEENPRYHITIAQGGTAGWETIQTNRPDVVILDLFMPDMNGFAVLEHLRATPDLRHIPVLVLTGADLNPEQHQQLTAFGQGLLTKGALGEKELLLTLAETLQTFRPSLAHTQIPSGA